GFPRRLAGALFIRRGLLDGRSGGCRTPAAARGGPGLLALRRGVRREGVCPWDLGLGGLGGLGAEGLDDERCHIAGVSTRAIEGGARRLAPPPAAAPAGRPL